MEFNPYPDPFVYPPQGGEGRGAESAGASKPDEFGSPVVPESKREQGISQAQMPEVAPWQGPSEPLRESPPEPHPIKEAAAEPDFSEFEAADEAGESAPKNLWGFVGFFVVIGLIVGGWYFFANSGTPLKPPPSAEKQMPDSQPNLIAASLGGTIRNGGASVIIPPGALTSDMEIFIKRIAEGAAGASTDLYYLEPHGYKFLKPVTVIIPYKKNPSRLKYIQNGEIKYSPFAVDEASKTIRIEVMEF